MLPHGSTAGILASGVLLLAAATMAVAQDAPATPQDVSTSLDALKQRNRDLERRLTELEGKVGEGAEAQRLRREEVKSIVEQMLADNKAMLSPKWMENLTFAGDLRLRYELRQHTNDTANGSDKRGRVRLRFGFTKTWPDDDLEVGFRLATGSDSDPTSTNQSFQGFQKYSLWVDRAYAKWTPKAVKGLTVTAGKMENPWVCSDMIWDPDVNPDGAWLEYRVPGLGAFEPFMGAGIFQLNTANNVHDSGMMAYDVGLRWAVAKDVKFTSALSFFSFVNPDQAFMNTAIWKANPRGNTLVGGHLGTGFEEMVYTNKLDWTAFNLPMSAYIDWVQNNDNTLTNGQGSGYAVGYKVGQNKKKGDWSFMYMWKRLEADAVVAFFSESDFGWNTFTNRKGSQFGVQYNITDSMVAGLTFFLTEPIEAINKQYESRFTMQADLVWKF